MWRPDWQWSKPRRGNSDATRTRRCMIDNAPPGALLMPLQVSLTACSGWMIEKLSHINYNCNKERKSRSRNLFSWNYTSNRYKLQDTSQEIQDTSVRVHSRKVSNGFSISWLAQPAHWTLAMAVEGVGSMREEEGEGEVGWVIIIHSGQGNKFSFLACVNRAQEECIRSLEYLQGLQGMRN